MRVAVVIPCYQQAEFLPDTVASVCAQTYRDLEIVIVDDGSPDDTAGVAERLIAAHPGRQIRLLRHANQGLAASRNAGIAASDAEYVLPLDADDLIDPGFVEDLVRVLEARPDVSIAYGSLRYFGEIEEQHTPSGYDFARICHGNLFPCTALFRRRAWEEVGGYDQAFTAYEDWDFWLSCGEYGHLGALVPRPVFYYRRRPASMLSEAHTRDQRLKAQIVLNHPALFSPEQSAWARGILDQDPEALAIDGGLRLIPQLGQPLAAVARSGGAFAGARRLALLATADEVVERPELLSAFCSVFSGADDATLVICGSEAELARLTETVETLGLDAAAAADLLGVVVNGAAELAVAAGRVDGMLTERSLRLPVGLPRFGASRLPALRAVITPPATSAASLAVAA